MRTALKVITAGVAAGAVAFGGAAAVTGHAGHPATHKAMVYDSKTGHPHGTHLMGRIWISQPAARTG